MARIDFGGVKETVVTRKEFPMAKAKRILRNETIAVIGYGVQGPAQSLNLKDNGCKVIIGQSPAFPRDWDRARRDGWVPGKTLFDIEEACPARDHHPDARVRRRPEADLADSQAEHETRCRAVFFARLFHYF